MISIINFITLIIAFVLSIVSAVLEWPDIVTPITFGIAIIVMISDNWKYGKLLFLWVWNVSLQKNIRISMSYIYRIKVGNKYLLVKNMHNSKYQFVGGKYKFFPEAKPKLEKLSYSEDSKLGVEGTRKDDIAFFIPVKNLFKFLK